MKKIILSIVVLLALVIMPNKLLATGNVAKIDTTEYATMAAAIAEAESGDTIEVLANATANGLTLESGITLDVPKGVTLTLTGNTVTKLGSTVKNNGLIIVDNGVLDVSALEYKTTSGLIPGQDGLITIKSDGQVKMLEIWAKKTTILPDGWKPSIDSSILVNCESGSSIVIGEKTFVYDGSVWEGSYAIGTTNYESLGDAITAVTTTENTIKLLSDVLVPSGKIVINKDLTLDLNGHNISAVNKVLTVENAELTITGKGAIQELVPDYGALYVRGSNNVTDTNYTNINVGKDVTLIGWSPTFITIASDGSSHAYGVNININGSTLKAYKDTSSVPKVGHGIYLNGKIQDLTNYPNVTLNDGTTIISDGEGIYAAGYANWNIKAANISGVGAGLAIKSGKFTLNNPTVESTGNDASGVGYGNGINPTGATIQLESNAGYKGKVELTINSGTYTSTKGSTIYEYLDASAIDTAVESIVIKGGTFTSGTGKESIKVSDKFENKNVGFIEGGSYSTNPSAFVALGYKSVANSTSSKYDVSKVTLPTGTKTLSGTLTNGNNAIVQLKQGGVVLKTTLASATGSYSFTNVAAGTYNLVAINGTESILKVVEVGNENVTVNMAIPTTGSLTLIIVGANTPNIVAGGLETVTESEDVRLMIESKIPDSNTKTSIDNSINNSKKDVEYLEILLGGDEDFIEETEGMLEIIVPFDLSGKKDIELYRSHNNVVSKLTKLDAKPETKVDGTYYLDVDNNLIHIYANKFSTYAIAYTDLNNPKTSDNIITYIFLGTISLIGIASYGIYLNKKRLVAIK